MAKMRMLSFSELHPVKGIPFSRDYIRRLVNAGRFPKPIKLGLRPNARLAWVEQEIDEHLAALMVERDKGNKVMASGDRLKGGWRR
jgi:prophage regulatory protein